MAQARTRRKRGRLRKRLGLAGSRGLVVACLAVALGAGGVGAARAVADAGIVVEREDAGTEEPAGAVEDAVDASDEEKTAPRFVVHVDGAVAEPGVYELSGSDVRVTDAVEAAGGLLEDADTTGINLASPLVDGSKVHVPWHQEAPEEVVSGTSSGLSQAVPGLVNINMATEAELCALPGVGEATASAIVRDRETNGPFASPEDVMRVSGIGEKKFERMKDMICV